MRETSIGGNRSCVAGMSNEISGRLILRQGRLIDPANGIDAVMDLALLNGAVEQVATSIPAQRGDKVLNCEGLMVWPGLIDIHLHLHDLFEVTTAPSFCAAQDGVTLGISPGAGNTFMAPALLGAEMDRGLPLNAGVLLGGGAVLSSRLNDDELVALFRGTLPREVAEQKLTANSIVNGTAHLAVGIKEHMGHALLQDEAVERLYSITSQAELLFMSHTQRYEHTAWVESLSKGRPLHLGHLSAAGCGPDGEQEVAAVLELCKRPHVSGEMVTTMLRPRGGSREGLTIHPGARRRCLEALESGLVNVLVSDGQHEATMKGFGDTRDNIQAILELAAEGVLDLSRSVATMTQNPAALLAKRTGCDRWSRCTGHLAAGAFANVTVVDPISRSGVFTIVNGRITAFEGRLVREGFGAGRWFFARGMLSRVGVGDEAIFQNHQ